jgi:hypothetical protein
MQILFEQQRIHSVRVITWNALNHGIAMTFVERERGNVVHCRFQADHCAMGCAELLFRRIEQRRSNPKPAAALPDVNRDDMAPAASRTVSNQKAEHFSGLSLLLLALNGALSGPCLLGNQRKRRRMADIGFQFKLGVRNPGRKTGLVNFPQPAEIFWPVIANGKSNSHHLRKYQRKASCNQRLTIVASTAKNM